MCEVHSVTAWSACSVGIHYPCCSCCWLHRYHPTWSVPRSAKDRAFALTCCHTASERGECLRSFGRSCLQAIPPKAGAACARGFNQRHSRTKRNGIMTTDIQLTRLDRLCREQEVLGLLLTHCPWPSTCDQSLVKTVRADISRVVLERMKDRPVCCMALPSWLAATLASAFEAFAAVYVPYLLERGFLEPGEIFALHRCEIVPSCSSLAVQKANLRLGSPLFLCRARHWKLLFIAGLNCSIRSCSTGSCRHCNRRSHSQANHNNCPIQYQYSSMHVPIMRLATDQYCNS